MQTSKTDESPRLGYLTIVQESVRHLGGLLMLSVQARPLEFHCTVPVQPSRAQEILYGSSLRPYLYGEQIARTLVSKAKQPPTILVTDIVEIVTTRLDNDTPILFVAPEGSAASWNGIDVCEMQGVQVGFSSSHTADRVVASRIWDQYGHGLDLLEPFERIREALTEAQGAGNTKRSPKAA